MIGLAKMKLKSLICFVIISFLSHSTPSLLHAATHESIKNLEALLPHKSETQSTALDLSGADMRTYDLCAPKKGQSINFRKANLKGANFAGMEICNVDFEGANLEKANFEGATITKCNFRHVTGPANFTRASIKYTGFNQSKLGASLFTHGTLESTGFDSSDLRNANFDHSNLTAVNFYKADLTDYSHEGASMDRTNFEKSIGTSWLN